MPESTKMFMSLFFCSTVFNFFVCFAVLSLCMLIQKMDIWDDDCTVPVCWAGIMFLCIFFVEWSTIFPLFVVWEVVKENTEIKHRRKTSGWCITEFINRYSCKNRVYIFIHSDNCIDKIYKTGTGASRERHLIVCACPWRRVSRWVDVDASGSSLVLSPIILEISPLLSRTAISFVNSIGSKRVVVGFFWVCSNLSPQYRVWYILWEVKVPEGISSVVLHAEGVVED